MGALYVFAVVFLQAVYSVLRDSDPDSEATYDAQTLHEFFGGVGTAMISLFMAISGGVDWRLLYKALADIHSFYGLMFVLFHMTTVYGILNVVTSIFVESAMLTAKTDRHLMMQDDEARRIDYMLNMRRIFNRADTDHSGSISWEEFESHLQDERMISYFAHLGLDTSEAANLFRILDVDNSDDISIDEFLVGCFRLKGDAKQLDLATLMYENKRMIERLSRFMAYSVEEFEHLKSGIVVLSDFVTTSTVPPQEYSMSAALWPEMSGAGHVSPTHVNL